MPRNVTITAYDIQMITINPADQTITVVYALLDKPAQQGGRVLEQGSLTLWREVPGPTIAGNGVVSGPPPSWRPLPAAAAGQLTGLMNVITKELDHLLR